MKFLIILVIVLVIIALAQLMKVYELSSKLRLKDEADVTRGETKFNAGMLLLFYVALMVSSTWLFLTYGGRPGPLVPASEYGVDIDNLYWVNWAILLVVFYLTQTLLFVFAIKYQKKKGRKAVFFAHSTKLELVWTVIPAVVLAGIIIGGLTVWNKITAMPEDATVIELYAKQFGWQARYSGEDNTLGNTDFKVITGKNELGVVTSDLVNQQRETWEAEIEKLQTKIKEEGDLTPDDKLATMKDKIARLERQIVRLEPLMRAQSEETDKAAMDDVIVKELVLLKDRQYEFKFRSRDVIHSAYFPHFRAQMNCVPGMTTRFAFKPIISTAEMRKMPRTIKKYDGINEQRVIDGKEEVEFDYVLLCNKICGGSHYNMQMKITVVDTQAEFDAWYSEQKESKSFPALVGLVDNSKPETTDVPMTDSVPAVDTTMTVASLIK